MVGFGDRIKGLCEDRREWASYYIDYKALKRLIKVIMELEKAGAGEEVDDAEDSYVLLLESELAKVESFFRCKEGVFVSELRQLQKTVSTVEKEVEGASECETIVEMLSLLKGGKEAQILKDVLACAQAVDDLREFVFANVQATIKINKKHDKNSKIKLREKYCGVMHGCLFYCSPQFGKLIRDAKILVSSLFEKLGGRGASPEDFRCFICSHVFNNPLMLKCGHFACFRCINSSHLFKAQSCPICLDEFKFDHENLQVLHLLKILQETRFTGPRPDVSGSDTAPLGASRDKGDEEVTCSSAPARAVICTLASPCAKCKPSTPRTGGMKTWPVGLNVSESFDENEANSIKISVFRKFSESGRHLVSLSCSSSMSRDHSPPHSRECDLSATKASMMAEEFGRSISNLLSPTKLMRTTSAYVSEFESYKRNITMWKVATIVAILSAILGLSLAVIPSIRYGLANWLGLEYVGDGHCRQGEWGYMGESTCAMESELNKLQEERKKWLMKTLDKIVKKS